MHFFQYRNAQLCAEEVPLERIAREVGTPCYVYSRRTLERHLRAFEEAFAQVAHRCCFSVKANGNLALLRLIHRRGWGFEVVSAGELCRVLAAGGDPSRVVFSGVGKRPEELELALEAGVMLFNVESSQELELLAEMAASRGVRAPVALRVNPDIQAPTHPHLATAGRQHKFGIDPEEAHALYRRMQRMPGVVPRGLHFHLGSQITRLEPFVEAIRRVSELWGALRKEGIELRYLDIGGGLGIPYGDGEAPPGPAEYARAVCSQVGSLQPLELILEPGRAVVGNAGVLLTRVLYTKRRAGKRFAVVDAGMNDLLRPSLYGARQEIRPLRRDEGPRVPVEVVGPVCESGDVLGRGCPLPDLRPGDLLAIMGAGAYGFSMSSNYNARPRAAEVLVDGERYFVVRERETYEDLMRGEAIPPELG